MYDDCDYTADELNSTNGWNKVGRICFVEGVSANIFKMHLGWIFRDDPNTISFSLFYHNNKEEVFVSHKIDERNFTDANLTVDMYLGRTVIGMIINNEYDLNYDVKCIGIKEDNSNISVSKDSYVSKTFYFGGVSKAPHEMNMKFHDQRVDDPGYQTKFNSNDIMTWNLSEFKNGDIFSYTAGKVINGSVADRNTVQYHTNHPNKEYQKCIIHSGAEISFTAGEIVHLYPGFHAKQGSKCIVKIAPPLKISVSTIPLKFDDKISYEVRNVESVELGFYTDQTRDSLVYGKQFYVDTRSSKAETSIDTVLTLNLYYAVANLYSGRGCHKRIEGWVVNNRNNVKNDSITKSFSVQNASSELLMIENSKDTNSKYYIFPNPTNGTFSISYPDKVKISLVEIFDPIGNKIFSSTDNNTPIFEYDLTTYKSGIYYVKITANEYSCNLKIVKY